MTWRCPYDGRAKIAIIAGPSGAGKTTFAREFLPRETGWPFINADLITEGIAPFDPESATVHAGRSMIQEKISMSGTLPRKETEYEWYV